MQLPAAFRSLSRPSSAPDAKAFSLCSSSFERPFASLCLSFVFYNCSSFCYHLRGSIVVPFRKDHSLSLKNVSSIISIVYSFPYSVFYEHYSRSRSLRICPTAGGDEEIRTLDPLLAGQVLSQLSYTPIVLPRLLCATWWAQVDSNHRPRAYQARALTT